MSSGGVFSSPRSASVASKDSSVASFSPSTPSVSSGGTSSFQFSTSRMFSCGSHTWPVATSLRATTLRFTR